MPLMQRRNKIYRHFRELLVQERKHAGVTQAELGRRIGKPQNFVSKFESGERRLDVVEFLYVARALNLRPARFLKVLDLLLDKA